MHNYSLSATLWQEGKQYVAKCPELGVASCGDTLEEALEALKEAVELYLENAAELGLLGDLTDTLSAQHRFAAPLEVSIK
ncbi:MAG: type II toxin-antitoxin system HicB family antitoxin [Armatimonadetes bacterium]|nr:type II toxin-antitoxin system HicB family antitoxin [Armatimonadota bacterium]NIO96186.1 type II toxin-antitoxin system HicB family antitoxin [Armatimonadota bacterium]